jgi:hypothetical protein
MSLHCERDIFLAHKAGKPSITNVEWRKMRKTSMFISVAVLIGTILMAACGQAAAATANPGSPVVASLASAATAIPQSTGANSVPAQAGNCTLLSKDEIGTVLGEAVVDVRDEAKSTICVYQTQNLILELDFLNTGALSGDQYLQNIRSINSDGVTIPGLGDDAFNNAHTAYPILFVRKGNSVYTFGVRSVTVDQSLSSPDNAQALEKTLAELLLSRLS